MICLRNEKGVGIPEFAICLIAMLLAFIPICNVTMFTAACFTIQLATSEVANLVSMAESRKEALQSAATIGDRLRNPIWTSMHTVKEVENKRGGVFVQLQKQTNIVTLPLDAPLPAKFKPGYEDNLDKYRYVYCINVPCEIHPFFNISGFPAVGQIPAIGAPVKYLFHAESPVECLESLER
jgi:hypothetical protein